MIACIEDQAVIDKILKHLQAKGEFPLPPDLLPDTRASPNADWIYRAESEHYIQVNYGNR